MFRGGDECITIHINPIIIISILCNQKMERERRTALARSEVTTIVYIFVFT